MHSRRKFLTALAAGVGASAVARPWAAAQADIKTTLNGPVGLQLWSLRAGLRSAREGEGHGVP